MELLPSSNSYQRRCPPETVTEVQWYPHISCYRAYKYGLKSLLRFSGVILIETKQNLFKFEFCHKRRDVPLTEDSEEPSPGQKPTFLTDPDFVHHRRKDIKI